MKLAHTDFFLSRGGSVSLWKKASCCLLPLLMLALGGSECLAADIRAAPVNWLVRAAAQQSGSSKPSKTDPPAKGSLPVQSRQKQPRQEPVELQTTNPLEVLRLAFEALPLVASQTREGAEEAIQKYKAAFAIFKNQDFKPGMAACLFACGAAYYFLGQNREALEVLSEASEYARESGLDALLRPLLDVTMGAIYVNLGETAKALELLNRGLPMLRGNEPILALTLKGLGDVHVQLGQKRKGIKYLSEALTLYQKLEDRRQEVQILTLLSALKSSLGQATEAIQNAELAIARAKEKGLIDAQAYGYFTAGAAYAAIGSLERAAAAYNQSLALFRGQKDRSGEITALNNLGLLAIARGDLDRALSGFESALKLAQSGDEEKLAAYVSNNIGTIYSRRGEPIKAFQYFKAALDSAVRHKDKRLEAAVLSSLADTYFLINSREYALKLLEEAASAFSALEEPGRESEALISLADGYTVLGQYQKALTLLQRVLASPQLEQDPYHKGYVLREMGYIYNRLGARDEALRCYEQALTQLEAARDDIGKVDLYIAWAAALTANQEYRKAEEYLTKGLAIAHPAGLRQSEQLIFTMLGFLHQKQGDLAPAEDFYEQAIRAGEALRSSARIEEIKVELSSISAGLFSQAILLKFKLGKWSEAFELAEKARARTFLDQLNNTRIDVRQGAGPDLADREQALRFELRALEETLRKERRSNPSSEAARLLANHLKAKEEAYAALLIRLKAGNPGYAQLQSYTPAPLKEIQRLLGPQTTLISYFVTAETTLAFVIRSDSFAVLAIPVKEADLREAIYWFRDFASLRDPALKSLQQLDAWLIAPIRQYIKTSEVIIAPHGILHYVPFSALTDGGSYFGDDHSIYHLPSASTLPLLRRRIPQNGKRLLSLSQARASGLPWLRYVDAEARSIANLYNTQALATGRATKVQFRKRARAHNLLHIAAHAELNPTAPLFSRIRLASTKADNGAIEVREIYEMNLTRTNLVVLSACETHLGAQSRGDDLVGLNRAFLYAGTASVIASLWTVDDKATSLLMRSFYTHLKKGLSKAAALQAAQRATRKQYPHPYYWAAFVLTGHPGTNRRR
jgi:CHAT domain-containing protein